MNLRLALAVLLGTTTVVLSASAQQPWIQDRRLGEGPGIRTGNLELHPSVAAEFGYDSNYFQRGPEDPEPVEDTLRFRVTPSLTLSTLGKARTDAGVTTPPLLDFSLGGYATYNVFIPLDDTDSFDNRSKLSGGVRAALELFPKRPISWDLNAAYRRDIDPSDVATGETDFDRHTLSAGTGVTWTPGGGLFNWRVGYGITGIFFSEGEFELLNNAQHVFETRGQWKFLPRTAAIYDGSVRLIRYSNDDATHSNGEVIQSRVGLNGLLTNRFGFRILGGWAASFYDTDENFDGPVGNAEVKFFLTRNSRLQPGSANVGLSSIAVGYDRAYAHSYLGPFYQRDQGYLSFEYFIGGVVVTSLRGHVSRNSYPTFEVSTDADNDPDTANTLEPVDVHETRLGGTLFAEYRVTSIVGINATFDADRNIGGGDNPIPIPPEQDDLDFMRFQAYLGARVFW